MFGLVVNVSEPGDHFCCTLTLGKPIRHRDLNPTDLVNVDQ